MTVAGVQPIPVMLMTRDLDQGGVQRDVVKIATHLNRGQFQPHVATYFIGGIRHEELRRNGIPVLHLPVSAVLSRKGFSEGIRLRHYLKEHSIQILHAFDTTAVLGVPVARSLRLPAVLSSQLSYRDIWDWKTQALMRMTDWLVDAVVVNCEAMQRYMVKKFHMPARQVELCYNGVDPTQFYPAQAQKPDVLAGASLVIGTVCALRPEKALPLLQEAFARVRRLAEGMKLLIVGGGPELPKLKNNAVSLGIEDASVFIPPTSDVSPWLRAIDIFALPSASEAFSNSLLEAMACGCAVVGSRVGGTPELIGEDERGLLFRSGDADDLAAKLTSLIVSQQQRCEKAANAVAFVKKNLTIEIAARRTGEIYKKALGQMKDGRIGS